MPIPKDKPPVPGAPMPDQRSTTDQLRDLILYANQKGMYDAADAIQNLLRPENRVTSAEVLMAVLKPGDDARKG